MTSSDLTLANADTKRYEPSTFTTHAASYSIGDKIFFQFEITEVGGGPSLDGAFLFGLTDTVLLGPIDEIWQYFPPYPGGSAPDWYPGGDTGSWNQAGDGSDAAWNEPWSIVYNLPGTTVKIGIVANVNSGGSATLSARYTWDGGASSKVTSTGLLVLGTGIPSADNSDGRFVQFDRETPSETLTVGQRWYFRHTVTNVDAPTVTVTLSSDHPTVLGSVDQVYTSVGAGAWTLQPSIHMTVGSPTTLSLAAGVTRIMYSGVAPLVGTASLSATLGWED